jgi:hypothetical protein
VFSADLVEGRVEVQVVSAQGGYPALAATA